MVLVNADEGSGAGDPLVGKVVHDRFRIIAPIARGGMGAVYTAEQAPLGRLVAIKILSPKHDEDKDPEFRRRFFLEAATVAKLSHPNTVTVFDYGQSDGLYFIVMELLEGVTLKTALRRDGAFTPQRAIHVVKQICRSLREAHRVHIIHRDMKPGNVMLLEQGDENDYVKVLDFGLVKDIDPEAEAEEDLTQAGVFMGSPKYMSPEQIQGDRVDARSDIYSVGVLFYEMLTGAPPFVREKQVQILMDHINAPVPPLMAPEGRAPIPDEIAAIAMRCLAKKREDRFDDMDQLLNALKAVSGELPAGSASFDLGMAGTPVSGVHTLAADAMRASSSGSISAPHITGSGSTSVPGSAMPSVTPSTPAAYAVDLQDEPSRSGPWLTIGLAAAAVVIAIGIGVVVLDPFSDASETRQTTASLPSETPATREPEPVAAQPVEPSVPEPAPIRSVIVELDSTPPGAMVRIGDAEYGPTPAQVELTGERAEPGVELTFAFTADGYESVNVTRAVPRDGTLDVSTRMRRIRRAPPRGGAHARDEGPAHSDTPAGYRDSPY